MKLRALESHCTACGNWLTKPLRACAHSNHLLSHIGAQTWNNHAISSKHHHTDAAFPLFSAYFHRLSLSQAGLHGRLVHSEREKHMLGGSGGEQHISHVTDQTWGLLPEYNGVFGGSDSSREKAELRDNTLRGSGCSRQWGHSDWMMLLRQIVTSFRFIICLNMSFLVFCFCFMLFYSLTLFIGQQKFRFNFHIWILGHIDIITAC